MLTPTALLGSLTDRGVKLSSDSGRLFIDAPAGILTEADRKAIVESKNDLIALLSLGRPDDASHPSPWWLPRPPELATWPIPWRERWGRRANELAKAGVPFPDDERTAFAEVKASKEAASPSLAG